MNFSFSISPFTSHQPISGSSPSRKRGSEEERPESRRITRSATKAASIAGKSREVSSAPAVKRRVKVETKEQALRVAQVSARVRRRGLEEENPKSKRVAREAISDEIDVETHVAQMMEGSVPDAESKALLVAMVKKMPRKERASVSQAVALLLKGVLNSRSRARIVEAVCEIPTNEWASVLQAAAPLLKGVLYGFSKVAIIKAVSEIPKDERASVLAAADLLLEGIIDGHEKAAIIKAVCEIPANRRVSVLAAAASVMEDISDGYERVVIVKAVSEIPTDEQASVLAAATLLIKGIFDGYQRAQIIGVVSEIPTDERASVSVVAASLLEGIFDGHARSSIIVAVRRIPVDERASVSAALRRLVEGVHLFNDRASLICLASRLSVEVINEITRAPAKDRLTALQNYETFLTSPTSYAVTINREKLKKEPRLVLHKLAEEFEKSKRSKLSIVFIRESGVDTSGLSREFISLLFKGLTEDLHFSRCTNGLYRPSELRGDEERAAYNELGKLMLFCLNARNYPIGMVFDLGVFAALSTLLKCDTLGEEAIPFENYFAAYQALHCNEDDKQKIAMITAFLKPLDSTGLDKDLQDFFALVEHDEEVVKLHINSAPEAIKKHYPVLQEALKRSIIESTQPVVEMAKGIKSAQFTKMNWENVREMTAEEFSEKLQGRFSKELVLNMLHVEEGVSLQKQEWIKDWIRVATEDKVKQFLFALTGANAVGNASLEIKDKGENIYFHTCFNSVDMPFSTIDSKETLISSLEIVIADPGKYSKS